LVECEKMSFGVECDYGINFFIRKKGGC